MLCFMGHTLMENRNGLIVQAELTRADGHAERQAALAMLQRQSSGSTRRHPSPMSTTRSDPNPRPPPKPPR